MSHVLILLNSRPHAQGLCSWTPRGAQPQTPNTFPMLFISPPNLGCLDRTLATPCQRKRVYLNMPSCRLVSTNSSKVAERRFVCRYNAFIMSWLTYGGSFQYAAVRQILYVFVHIVCSGWSVIMADGWRHVGLQRQPKWAKLAPVNIYLAVPCPWRPLESWQPARAIGLISVERNVGGTSTPLVDGGSTLYFLDYQ